MDQVVATTGTDRDRAVGRLRDFIVASVDSARRLEAPFYHLVLDRVFPDDIYAGMIAAMPVAADYRPLHGRNQCNVLADGTHTRVKIDLFPEYIRHFPPEKRALWDIVGRALCAPAVTAGICASAGAGAYAPLRTGLRRCRDVPDPGSHARCAGLRHRSPHRHPLEGDHGAALLPRDNATAHIGTIFHEKLADGSLPKRAQMKFSPNTGYAFAVGEDAWHSADPVGPEVTTRDSILHIYFVDAGWLRFLRNRGKRVGNFVRNETRNYSHLNRHAPRMRGIQ